MEKPTYLTPNQATVISAALRCTAAKNVTAIFANKGIGVEYAISALAKENAMRMKIIHVNCIYAPSFRHIIVAILRVATNVKFSNLNYLRVNLDYLSKVLLDRMQKDLKGSDVLLVIDNIQELDKSGYRYLHRFLLSSKDKVSCGILIRITYAALSKLKQKSPDIYDNILEVLDDKKNFVNNTPSEMKEFIRMAGGISDEDFINDLASKTYRVGSAIRMIERYIEAKKRE